MQLQLLPQQVSLRTSEVQLEHLVSLKKSIHDFLTSVAAAGCAPIK
jgi:hypothetical protein